MLLNLQDTPNRSMKEPFSKFLVESGGGPQPRAMGDANLFYLHLFEGPDRCLELVRGQEIEMGPAENCVEMFFLHFMDHVIDDIDHSGMGAA